VQKGNFHDSSNARYFSACACLVRAHNVPAATKLTIGHSTINPRISPLWIAQEKGYFFTGVDIVTTRGFIAEQSLLIENMLKGP
jgi:hypothetical protein